MTAVPRANFVILSRTHTTFGLPLEGIGPILGVDTIMDMARTTLSLIGNRLTAAVMARWEGEFQPEKAADTARLVAPSEKIFPPANDHDSASE